jgi:hypothetical protein
MLEQLRKTDKPRRWKEIVFGENPVGFYLPDGATPNYIEAETRGDVVDSRFALLRMATAARHRLISRGEFPKSSDQFGPLLQEGPPKDPFSSGPLRFTAIGDSLLCYSLGPDRRDDHATIEYDPTNGTLSGGDIWTEVPRQRLYPFPRNGVRAASEEDLVRQFPHGLPLDPFASSRGKPFGTTTSLTGDLFIYSYGPDVDENRHSYPVVARPVTPEYFLPMGNNGNAPKPTLLGGSYIPGYGPVKDFYGQPQRVNLHVLEVPYDPTNGTVSEGDIFMRVPKR